MIVRTEHEIIIPPVVDWIFHRLGGPDARTSIADIPDGDLKEIGEQWTLDLINRAIKIRNAPKCTEKTK